MQNDWNKRQNVTATLMRKSATSSVPEKNRQDLSILMMHSSETARKHYLRVDNESARVGAETILNLADECDQTESVANFSKLMLKRFP